MSNGRDSAWGQIAQARQLQVQALPEPAQQLPLASRAADWVAAASGSNGTCTRFPTSQRISRILEESRKRESTGLNGAMPMSVLQGRAAGGFGTLCKCVQVTSPELSTQLAGDLLPCFPQHTWKHRRWAQLGWAQSAELADSWLAAAAAAACCGRASGWEESPVLALVAVAVAEPIWRWRPGRQGSCWRCSPPLP